MPGYGGRERRDLGSNDRLGARCAVKGKTMPEAADRVIQVGTRVTTIGNLLEGEVITGRSLDSGFIPSVELYCGKFKDRAEAETFLRAFFETGLEQGWLCDELGGPCE